jgi:hypothetical protein
MLHLPARLRLLVMVAIKRVALSNRVVSLMSSMIGQDDRSGRLREERVGRGYSSNGAARGAAQPVGSASRGMLTVDSDSVRQPSTCRRCHLVLVASPTALTLRHNLKFPLIAPESPYGRLIGVRRVKQRQLAIRGQILLRRMAAEQLELRTDDALFAQIRDGLMSDQMRIDSLRKRRGRGVPFHKLSNAQGAWKIPRAVGCRGWSAGGPWTE